MYIAHIVFISPVFSGFMAGMHQGSDYLHQETLQSHDLLFKPFLIPRGLVADLTTVVIYSSQGVT